MMRKILAIKFKYLGDVAIMVPALRTLKEHYSTGQLQVLVAEDAVPILQNIPWIDRVWGLPRIRGKFRLKQSLPVIQHLREENFDLSIDFVGNDRGAFISRLIGARKRIGVISPRWRPLQQRCYTDTIKELDTTRHEIIRDIYTVRYLKTDEPKNLDLEVFPDPSLLQYSESILPDNAVIFHISASQKKKEWPLSYWVELYQLMGQLPCEIFFSSGPSDRERSYIQTIKNEIPQASILPHCHTLRHFIAAIARASYFISPDTAPLHLASGLRIPTHSIFGPTASSRWAPLEKIHTHSQGKACFCDGRLEQCISDAPCIYSISAGSVWNIIKPHFIYTTGERL